MSSEHLVRTKLFAPSFMANVIPRERLDDSLKQLTSLRLLIIQAPAGYGKTTLISNWLHQSKQTFAWFSLAETDNDVRRFLQYVVAALESFAEDFEALQTSLKQDSFATDIALTQIVNSLTTLNQDVILVLDDYHLINDQDIHDAVQFLLEHLPQRLHLVITSRTPPPLSLARFRVRRQIQELTAEDLRFQFAEVSRFLNELMRLNLSDQELSILAQRSEGWVASLQLAALSLKAGADNSRFVSTFQGSDPFVFEYLADEVFAQQSKAIQDFLLSTSVLERFSLELAQVITDSAEAAEMLAKVQQANLFLIPLDEPAAWFRYHHLFSDFLQQKLKQSTPELVATLHTRASTWFEAQGYMDEAIRHVIAGGDIERAVELVEAHSHVVMWQRDDRLTLKQWLAALPEEVVRANPRLSLDQAWLRASSQASEVWIEDAERVLQYTQNTRSDLWGEALVLRAERNIAKGESGLALEQLNEALDLLQNPHLQGITEQTKGYLLRVRGDVVEAEDALRKAAEHCRISQNLIGELASLCDLAEVLKLQGRLEEAKHVFQKSLNLATQGRNQPADTGSAAMIGLADVLREQNDLETAQKLAQEGLERSQNISYQSIVVYAHEVLARVHLAKAEFVEVLAHLDSIDRVCADLPSGQRRTRIEAHCTPLWLALGEQSKAQKWLHEGLDEIEDAQQEREHIAHARIFLSQNKTDEALTRLKVLYAQSHEAKRSGRSLEVLVLIARAWQMQNEPKKALSTLEEALELAEQGNYIRLFTDEGEHLKQLLQQAIASSKHAKYIAKVLKTFTSPQEDQGLNQDLLTRREQQILDLIAQGFSNEAIAEKLIRSVGTIKTHTSNIYSKLGVSSRTEAVARARELELLGTA